ncbi:MAG: type 1 glutamine amidotransferase [Verrucomicrobiales bacterium]|jgi:type 1 glutamine amidotransferase
MKSVFLTLAIALFATLAHAGPHLVFLIGEKEYETGQTLPEFFETDLKPAGYTAEFIKAPDEGDGRNDFPGMAAAIAKADLVVVSIRRRAPKKTDLDALRAHLEAGKPLIGVRTSSHAFDIKGKPIPDGHDVWEGFDPEVLGGNYNGHFNDDPFVLTVTEGAADHPILKGVKIENSARLYRSGPLKKGTQQLLTGSLEGQTPEPIAWTNRFGPNKARIFYTSGAIVQDFEDAGFRLMLKNAFAWALSKDSE